MALSKKTIQKLVATADGFDRSWTFGDGVQDERFLLFFDGDDCAEDLAKAATEFGFDKPTIMAWQAALENADAIGLSANASLTSLRLYTQYWDLLANRIAQNHLGPFPLYRGWKKMDKTSERHDDYICIPMAPETVYLPRIHELSNAAGFEVEDLKSVAAKLSPQNVIYAEISNPNRKSWLATVRKAELNFDTVVTWISKSKALPEKEAILDQARRHHLLHLAGGADSHKGAFFSIYFEADQGDIERMLSL